MKSGTSRSHAQRAEGGMPSRTFVVPEAIDAALTTLAAIYGSRSKALAEGVRLLAKKHAIEIVEIDKP